VSIGEKVIAYLMIAKPHAWCNWVSWNGIHNATPKKVIIENRNKRRDSRNANFSGWFPQFIFVPG
jgi:hypothetical protein